MDHSTSRPLADRSPVRAQLLATATLVGVLAALVLVAGVLGSIHACAAVDGSVLLGTADS